MPTRMPALSLAAVPGRRNATLALATDIERRGFTGILGSNPLCPVHNACSCPCMRCDGLGNVETIGGRKVVWLTDELGSAEVALAG